MRGRRLQPQQRREQLLDVGAKMFAEKPYEDVFVEDIATAAGVSRATFYHYFPSKRDLYVTIFKRASTRLLAHANPDPVRPLADQLGGGLDCYIQHFVDHPFEAIAMSRGALSDDPAVQAIVTDELNVIGHRLIDKLVAEGRYQRDVTEVAIEGWLAFIRAACVKWVESQKIARADLAEMCLRAFHGALGIDRSEELMHKCLCGAAFSGVAELTGDDRPQEPSGLLGNRTAGPSLAPRLVPACGNGTA